jgi:nucleolar protein 4
LSDNCEDEKEEHSSEEDEKSAGSEDEDQEENFDSGEEDDADSQNEGEKSWKGQNVEIEKKSDVGEGKTVFVRNLDFSTAQDSLKNYMEKFGAVHYALLCMDKVMERPRGTGFIKFKVFLLFSYI